MIDTHVHLIEPDRFDYPWLADVPELAGRWDLARWSDDSQKAEIVTGIFVEVDVAESDRPSEARHFCQIAADSSNKVAGVVAACRPEEEGFEAHLDSIDSPYLVGLRRVLHVAPEGTMRAPLFARNLNLLADRDLPFDLCLRPDQLAGALELVDACPHTQFVLDHAGNPPVLTDAFETWRNDLANLAVRPNVVCKISGLVNHVPETADPLETLQPVIDYVADQFGMHRLLFGGDWPVCTLAGFSLADWVGLVEHLTSSWSQGEVNALVQSNAQRVYRVGLSQ